MGSTPYPDLVFGSIGQNVLSPRFVGPILRLKCLRAQCISNTTRVCLKALEKHFFLLDAVPDLPDGRRYVAVALGENHIVLLRDDGRAFAPGATGLGQCKVPALPEGKRYTAVVAGWNHSMLLRDDGGAVAFADNDHGHCKIPDLPQGVHYVAGDQSTDTPLSGHGGYGQ